MDCDVLSDIEKVDVATAGVSEDAACGSPASGGTMAADSRPFCTGRCKKCSNCICHKNRA